MNRRVLFLAVALAVLGLFEVHGAFSQTGSALRRRAVNLPERSKDAAYSNAILLGDTLYLSGQIGFDLKTGRVPATIEDEAKQLMDSYKRLLEQAGMGMDDLVYVQIATTDLSYYDKFNAVYRTYFNSDLPAREFIGVASLFRGGHFEMQAIAVRR